MTPALVLFDVDGTIFNSEAIILDGFRRAFATLGLDPPLDCAITRTIGLSLELAVSQMAPNRTHAEHLEIAKAYKYAVHGIYEDVPFYAGMRSLIGALAQYDHLFLGVATGKNRRGLDPLLESKGLAGWFSIRQTPDHHPSKPHPSMILDAIDQWNFDPHHTVMIGDTSFDIEMAHNAGVRSIGVEWGYHGEELLAARPHVLAKTPVDIFDALRRWELL